MSELLLDHYNSPYHKGRPGGPTKSAEYTTPGCGDHLRMFAKVREGRVVGAWFEGHGCVISQAAASILCEHVEGLLVTDVAKINMEDLVMKVLPSRQSCLMLAWRVLILALTGAEMQVTFVRDTDTDWMGLYINGRLALEGHSFGPTQILGVLGIEHDVRTTDLPHGTGLPEYLKDVK